MNTNRSEQHDVLSDVTVVIVNFQTPALLEQSVRALRQHYPAIKLLIIDNGSKDESAEVLGRLMRDSAGITEVVYNSENIHHGPGMDQGIRAVSTPFVFILDSDCDVLRGGVVEGMKALLLESPQSYISGKLISMNRRGFDNSPDEPGAIPYIRPFCMMVRRDIYLKLPPFERHGAPCLENMKAAVEYGYQLIHFPVEDYTHHHGRGTASVHGYRLGLVGKLNHLLNKLGL